MEGVKVIEEYRIISHDRLLGMVEVKSMYGINFTITSESKKDKKNDQRIISGLSRDTSSQRAEKLAILINKSQINLGYKTQMRHIQYQN